MPGESMLRRRRAVETGVAAVKSAGSMKSAGVSEKNSPVPPAAPTGEVYVTSFGFTDMGTGPDGSTPGRLMHARLAISNGITPSSPAGDLLITES